MQEGYWLVTLAGINEEIASKWGSQNTKIVNSRDFTTFQSGSVIGEAHILQHWPNGCADSYYQSDKPFENNFWKACGKPTQQILCDADVPLGDAIITNKQWYMATCEVLDHGKEAEIDPVTGETVEKGHALRCWEFMRIGGPVSSRIRRHLCQDPSKDGDMRYFEGEWQLKHGEDWLALPRIKHLLNRGEDSADDANYYVFLMSGKGYTLPLPALLGDYKVKWSGWSQQLYAPRLYWKESADA